ncbi:MAG: DUF2157 domain-containing protein [Actinomycetota bacterium]|nr:DUF2157 domain-containing protein [Actinomycetota bacterium]
MDRAAQIQAFKAELLQLAKEGITLEPATLDRIRAHHSALFVDEPDDRLSLAMRLASFVGAVALSAAIFTLFYRFWGQIALPVQVGILVAGPVLLVGVTHLLKQWERSGYFATLAALAAFSAFVLDLSVLGKVYNLPPTPHAFLAWGAFGLILGWQYGLRLPHFAGLVALGLWISAIPGHLRSEELPDLWGRGEAMAVTGTLFLLAPLVLKELMKEWEWQAFDLRIVGMVGLFLGIFILCVEGNQSWLPMADSYVEALYQLIGFIVGGVVVALGIRDRLAHLANGGMIFLTILVLLKATNWWWELVPRWVFFLILAGVAIGVLFALRRIRDAMIARRAA